MKILGPFRLMNARLSVDPAALILGLAGALLVNGQPASAGEQRRFVEANIHDLHDLLGEVWSCSGSAVREAS